METLTESLTSNSNAIVLKEHTIAEKADYSLTTSHVEDQNAPVYAYEVPQEHGAHPLILSDRSLALDTIENLISSIRSVKEHIQTTLIDGPVCPYQRTLLEYLGPNFVCPTIDTLALPQTFSSQKAVSSIGIIHDHYGTNMMEQLAVLSAEAADTTFTGITSENLGHAFAVLSSTPQGKQYVIDRQKTADHLEFAELIRNIPADYISKNPLIVAQKLVSRYIEINQN